MQLTDSVLTTDGIIPIDEEQRQRIHDAFRSWPGRTCALS